MPEKYAYGLYTRKQMLIDSMVLVEKMKQRPDYSPERIPKLLEREAGLEEKALRTFSSNPALKQFSSLGLDELAEHFGLAALYSTDKRTMRGALELYFRG